MNYLAVLVAGIASMILGAIYYGPLFGKMLAKLSKVKKKKEGMAQKYVMALIKTWIIAYVLAMFLDLTNITIMIEGLIMSLWLWLGFIATTTFCGVIWGAKPFKLWLVNNCFNLLSILMMAAILVYWV